MRKPVLAAGLALTLGCLLLYLFEPHFVRAVSRIAYDTLLRTHTRPPQSGQVAIVDLDESSLEAYGQWPWPRYLLATLTDRIAESGASVIGFDIVFAEKDRTSPVNLERAMNEYFDVDLPFTELPETLRDFDSLFARALQGHQTVLGCYMHATDAAHAAQTTGPDPLYRGTFYTIGTGDAHAHLFQAGGITFSIPELREAAASSAFFNTVPDFDSVVRSVPLLWAHGTQRLYPSMALEAVRLHWGIQQTGIVHSPSGIEHLRLNNVAVPTDAHGRLVVNYRSAEGDPSDLCRPFPTYSAAAVLEGRVGADRLRDKIVLIGTSAAGLRDLRATPLCPAFAGVHILATVVDNILSGDFLYLPAWLRAVDLSAIAFMGLFLTWVIHKQRAWWSFITTCAVIAALLASSVLVLHLWNLVLVPVRVLSAVIVIYPVLTMIRYWEHERHERWIRETFGAMVSDKVLRYLERTPAHSLIEGQKTQATVVFADMKGFSRIAEQLDPQDLSQLMNRFFNPMSQIVMNRDGYIDKYVGDLIMAVWGVPFPVSNHATQACLSALEQLEELARIRAGLKADFGCDIDIRIGVNTGWVTAGRLGSERRYDFAVMGDTVNVASRLEPLNKEYGTRILIGEATYRQAAEHLEARLLDTVTVAGRAQRVVVYELLGRKGEVPAPRLEAAHEYRLALEWHHRGDPTRATRHLERALAANPNDGPSIRLRKRLDQALPGAPSVRFVA